jgi:ferritin
MLKMKNLLSKSEVSKIQEAAKKELEVSNLYKHLSNQLQGIGYFGSAKFFLNESGEELKHYQLWADFVNDRGDVLNVPEVPGQSMKLSNLREAFEVYYEFEEKLGEFYNEWYMSTKDASVHQRLIEFVEIQTKSIGEAGDFLATLDQCEDDKAALLLFDKSFN